LKDKSAKMKPKKYRATRDNSEKIFVAKHLPLLPVIAAIIYAASSLFIDSVKIRIAISLVTSIFPWKELVKKIHNMGYTQMRTQLLVLMQVLCTSVSSGYSIEKSLTLVRPVIEHTFGKRSPLVKPLIALENDLKMHISLKDALDNFANKIKFPETVPVFAALSISGQIGNNTLAILRSACQMLSELNAVQNDIAAENAGKNAEAFMLCLMPFAITFALDRMSHDYMELAKQTQTGKILLAAAFILCVIAAALLFRFMSHEHANKQRKEENIKTTDTPITDTLNKILPTGFISSRHALFNELSGNPRQAYEKYLKKQILTTAVLAAMGALILKAAGKPLVLTIPIAFFTIFLNARDIRAEVMLKRENLMKDVPLFLCLMSTLLQAGMQLPKAIEICSHAFQKNSALADELKALRANILSGTSADRAVENFSLRIQIPEAQAALLLVARYGRLGTSEVLNLLSLQASACWNLTRNAARKKQEREALAMLLPMTLDFICVLIVAITPAIISMGI